MDYITKHYKNLSEQLAAKVNHLQQLLNEIATSGIMATEEYDENGNDEKYDEEDEEDEDENEKPMGDDYN